MLDSNTQYDIFISYSRKNKNIVLPIKEEIERTLGLRCWIDLSDIPCGSENFKRNVIPGIKQTRVAFLFFLSAESQASEYAIKEIGFASKRANKRVILIRINDDEMTDEFYFDFQNADIIDWRVPEQKKKLLHDLRVNSSGISVTSETNSSANVTPNQTTISMVSYGMNLGDDSQYGDIYTLSYPSVSSSYATAWKLVSHSFKRNEGVVFPAQWDGLLDAFWKAWSVKSEEAMRKATSLFLKADQHDPELQYRIGAMLSLGWFGESQRSKAKAWYEAAAGKDNYMAMLGIGDCYRTATGGLPQNQEISQSWYLKAFESMKRAAIKGDGRAMYHAGRLCRFGYLGEEHPKEGIAWWEKSVQTGNCESQHWLSREYASGEFVVKNMNKAISLCVDSAVGGLVSAMTKMGRYCKEGVPGVMNASLNDALMWYQLADEHGKPHSCKNQIDELLEQINNDGGSRNA